MATSEPRITISICTYDRYDLLRTAIDSACAQQLNEDFRILVVDNSPDHARAEAFGKLFVGVPNLSYVVEKIPGLSNARNVSARLCGTEFISYMDDDAIASPGWLKEILAAFDAFGPEAMVVGGQVRPIWGAPRPSWLHDSLLGNLSVVDWGGDARIAATREWFAGTNISFRTGAILSRGGFSTNLGRNGSGAALLSNEEIQLLEQIRSEHGTLVYAPLAYVDHLVDSRRLTRSWFRRRFAWQAVSDFLMDSNRHVNDAPAHWKDVVRYFNQLPPHERTIRGFIHETDDKDLFNWQLGAIYMFTLATLAGFDGVSLD
jgi:glycosyltransferase involved in cell wall biosynthesis